MMISHKLQEMTKKFKIFCMNIKKEKIWGGADVIISEKTSKELNNWLGNQPLVISFQTSAPMRRLVVTQHAVELFLVIHTAKRTI